MRIPKPHWKRSHSCWYVQIARKMYRLDPDKEKADEIWKSLIALHLTEPKQAEEASASSNPIVQDILLEFLSWTEKHREPGTLKWYQTHISELPQTTKSGEKPRPRNAVGFARFVGRTLRVRDLRPYHVTRWLDSRYAKANDNTRAGAVTAIKRAFAWAVDEGYISQSPVARVKKPSRTGRGEDAYLTPDQWQQVLAGVRDGLREHEIQPFLDYVTVMKETGCRPQEIRKVEARHLDRKSKQWVFPANESKGKREKRVVELGDVAFAICQRLALQRPEGCLFRNSDGKPWSNFALACRFKRLSEKLGFKVFAYAIRHTYATEAILNGVDVITISKLMGHSDLKMLGRIYQHVMRDRKHMQASREQATRSREAGAA